MSAPVAVTTRLAVVRSGTAVQGMNSKFALIPQSLAMAQRWAKLSISRASLRSSPATRTPRAPSRSDWRQKAVMRFQSISAPKRTISCR